MLLGLDIGVTNLKAGLVDFSGKIVRRETVATPDSFIDFRRYLDTLLSRVASGVVIDGAGICCPGVVNPSDTVVDSLDGPLNYLEGVRLGDLVTNWLPADATVCADNAAHAALAGELMFGAARGRKNALLLELGEGITGAVAVNGALVRGFKGGAGQLGHLTVDPFGIQCRCGNRGCLELYFSGRALELEGMAAVRRGCDSTLTGLAVTCEEVLRAAAAGDAISKAIVDRAVRFLGGAVAGLLHVLDSEIVIVSGELAAVDAPLLDTVLLDPVRHEIEERTRRLLGRAVPVVARKAGAYAGIIGAASLALHEARNERLSGGV